MKPKKQESSQPESMDQLKSIAQQFSKYFNNQYKENVSYTPDTDTIASVSVSKWLEMPEAVSDAIELPGLPMGNITCVYGKPDTGKTTFLQMGIAACVKKGVLPVLILTEHKFDFNRLSKFMNTNPDNILVFHADNIEQGYRYIEKILRAVKSGKLTYETAEGDTVELDISQLDVFIFWDSIGNTLSESELEYDIEDWDKSMGKAAKAIKTLTKRTNQLLGKVRQRVGICFLNQSYMSMPSYGPSIETPYGGDGVPYSSALVLRFRRVRDIDMTVKGKDIVIGLETKIEVKKNHISHKKPTTTVYTTAMGMVPATKEALEEYKKAIR